MENQDHDNFVEVMTEEVADMEYRQCIADFLVLEDKVESGTATPEELNYYLSLTHFDIDDNIEAYGEEVDANW